MSLERLNAALADRYRIEHELGAGGMATVYLAQDLRHQRKVAIKVLKPDLAAVLGADRFVHEITTTAQLQHPHILPLFDSGTAGGFLFYVMPYVEGETLRQKLDRETQLGVEEAVRITVEVADALDYAHRHGVIHRDIKPENILLHDGRPVVADFGIALAVSAAAGGRMTETGLSLGTPHYMSPEQATAEKEITGRSDIYSLASVLYEMLTGNPPHTGSSAQQIIMKIIAEPVQPVTTYRKAVPPNVAGALARALEKLPADRFESAKTFADALTNPAWTGGAVPGIPGGAARPRSRTLTAALAAVAIGGLAVAVWALTRPVPAPPVVRYVLSLPTDQAPHTERLFPILASDGSRLVYAGPGPVPGEWQLWIKARDQLTARPIPGTVGVTAMALSPDDRSLAVVQRGALRRLPLDGGSPLSLAENVSGAPGTVAWLEDGTLLFVPSVLQEMRFSIMRVSANGGDPTRAWSSDSLFPQNLNPLPDGRGALFMACPPPCAAGDLHVLDLRHGGARRIIPQASAGWYANGLLVVHRTDGHVQAVRFDLGALEPRGQTAALLDSVGSPLGQPALALSPSGTLVVQSGLEILNAGSQLVWVDRDGRETPVDTTWTFRVTRAAGDYGWALSPDDSRVAIGLNTSSGDDIWVKVLPRGPASRVTYGAGLDRRPRWSRDGRWVTYVSDTVVAMRRADGTGTDSVLWVGRADEAVLSPDGRWLLLRVGATSAAAGGRDILVMELGVDQAPRPLLAGPFDEMAIAPSPDGEHLAYQSDETGRLEIYVRPFPDVGAGKVQVSSEGGTGPLWARDGRELFYLRRDNMMVAVPMLADGRPGVERTRELFRRRGSRTGIVSDYYTPWDIARDGRFLMVHPVDDSAGAAPPLVVVENWLQEVKAALGR